MNYIKFIKDITEWGYIEDFIEAIVLVGSYARGTNKPTSDIDLCILTSNKQEILDNPDVFKRFGDIKRIETEYYGAVTSLRIWYVDGFEVEYGLALPSWIFVPLDEGTQNVLDDGYQVLVDKYDYFKNI